MTLYLIVAAAILIVSTAVTYSSKTVTNQHFLMHLILFPIVYFISGLPIEDIYTHFITAGLMFIASLFAIYYFKIGGGAARALVMAALWVPGLTLFINYISTTFIIIGIVALIMTLFRKSDRLDHQYNNQPTSSGHDLAAVQKIENVELPVLRGLNSFKLK